MKAKTFKVKKIAMVKDKRNFLVEFELAGGEWSNFFELSIKKEDTIEDMEKRITDRVKIMVADKDRENELRHNIVNKDIPLNGVNIEKKNG